MALGEDTETYLLEISQGGVITQTHLRTTPTWTGPLAAGAVVKVAQVSARFGPGAVQSITVPF